jgi:transcriptional regulator with XRE-family HTH domain
VNPNGVWGISGVSKQAWTAYRRASPVLRKYLGLSGEQLGSYLHTDKTKISKWERGEDPIGPAADRLVRLLATALDGELRPGISAVAEHLPQISDKPGEFWELHVDVVTLQTTFRAISKAA